MYCADLPQEVCQQDLEGTDAVLARGHLQTQKVMCPQTLETVVKRTMRPIRP